MATAYINMGPEMLRYQTTAIQNVLATGGLELWLKKWHAGDTYEGNWSLEWMM
jgi:hypothetical protein